MSKARSKEPVCFIGHPFATIGVGEQLRSHIDSALSVHLACTVMDIFRYAPRNDPWHRALLADLEIEVAPCCVRIFHVNGDEVDAVLKAFVARGGDFSAGYNIIVPAWELPRYPAEWASKLRLFDEIWALSHFIEHSLAEAGLASTYIGQAVDHKTAYFLPRRYFGIRESAFVLVHFSDLSSYSMRKNPDAVIELMAGLQKTNPLADLQLILKIKSAEEAAESDMMEAAQGLGNVKVFTLPMSTLEVRSLIRYADCFVSLHRAEGFGRGTAEAMSLGRLAIATGWSGNLDYMNNANSLLVDCRLGPVPNDAYPHAAEQIWAEPNVEHAISLLSAIIKDRQRGTVIAKAGHRQIREGFSFRAVGLRILQRIADLHEAAG